jgi:hypothetical protein
MNLQLLYRTAGSSSAEKRPSRLPQRKITMNAQHYGQHPQVIQKRRQAA